MQVVCRFLGNGHFSRRAERSDRRVDRKGRTSWFVPGFVPGRTAREAREYDRSPARALAR